MRKPLTFYTGRRSPTFAPRRSPRAPAGSRVAMYHLLPVELLQKVFLYLEDRDLIACACVCRSWSSALDGYFWRRRFRDAFCFEPDADVDFRSAYLDFPRDANLVPELLRESRCVKIRIDLVDAGYHPCFLVRRPAIRVVDQVPRHQFSISYYYLSVSILSSAGKALDRVVRSFFPSSRGVLDYEFRDYGESVRYVDVRKMCSQRYGRLSLSLDVRFRGPRTSSGPAKTTSSSAQHLSRRRALPDAAADKVK
ncbi:F-box domain protein [Nile crocodilepox virus]|uniref:F-box domain protein n=1 Tax=Nile crocodilepox virus (isolate Crocodylus niloticus/Zimbabwe/Ume/2001) TaxID=1289473 RepID=Q070M5_CPRVZ|nr:F-box domain protein [Nile crocodilepox virus]ABJ08917.1 F-box domain protein [Nile crocodilepox virus]